METKFNFNSSPCTSIEQSKRLLALGLKKETADMAYLWYGRAEDDTPLLMDKPSIVYQGIMTTHDLPAWSLHRLIEMMPMYFKETKIEIRSEAVKMAMKDGNLYDNLIDIIADCIKEGCFNKEY